VHSKCPAQALHGGAVRTCAMPASQPRAALAPYSLPGCGLAAPVAAQRSQLFVLRLDTARGGRVCSCPGGTSGCWACWRPPLGSHAALTRPAAPQDRRLARAAGRRGAVVAGHAGRAARRARRPAGAVRLARHRARPRGAPLCSRELPAGMCAPGVAPAAAPGRSCQALASMLGYMVRVGFSMNATP